MKTQQIINLLKQLEEGLELDQFSGNHGPNKLHFSDGSITLINGTLDFNLTYKEGNNGGGDHTLVAARNLFNSHETEIELDNVELTDNPHITFKYHQQGLKERIEFDFLWDNDKIRLDATIEKL